MLVLLDILLPRAGLQFGLLVSGDFSLIHIGEFFGQYFRHHFLLLNDSLLKMLYLNLIE
jgi:hypothetical protein